MNFVGIFFQLLIAGMFYKRGFCAPSQDEDFKVEYSLLLSDIEVSDEQSGISLGNFALTYLHKYQNLDGFYLHNYDKEMLFKNIFLDEIFSSAQLEFVAMYQLRLIYYFENVFRGLYVTCQFSNKEDIQKFFDSVNSRKPKADAIKIHKIVRYNEAEGTSNSTPQIELFAEQAELSVRDITNPTSNATVKCIIYYISHTSNTDEKVEADLIFAATKFSISPLYNGNTIALCLKDFPDIYFIIRFSNQQNPKKFIKDYIDGTQNNMKCKFPHLSSETIYYLNN